MVENEIQKKKPLSPEALPNKMEMHGDNGTQIANVGYYDDSKHMAVIVPDQKGRYGAEDIDSNIEFDFSCYNLFVMDGENYDGRSFVVKKEAALTESTAEDLRALCGSFSQDAIERIKTHPAVFAGLNHQYRKTDAEHMAHYGYVIGVEVLDEGIRISYVWLQSFPQQLLNDNLTAFGLESAWAVNELDNIHWAIKKVNLREALKDLGIRVLSY